MKANETFNTKEKDKHTPGPWKVDGTYIYEVGQDKIIAEVETYNDNELPYEANARLMAASPKMYEFIEKLATTLIPTGVAHSFASTSILHAIVDSAKNLTKEIEGDE